MTDHEERNLSPLGGGPDELALRVLLVTAGGSAGASLRKRLAAMGFECEVRNDARRAEASLLSEPFDLLICDDSYPASVAESLIRAMRTAEPSASAIWLASAPSVAETVQAMRIGFSDILSLPLHGDELKLRIDALLARQGPLRDRDRRLARWKQVCRRLNQARHESDRQAEELAGSLEEERRDGQRRIDEAVMTSEFKTLLRQELEVESLLRTAMEYLLTKTGPTNAAVFLNNGGGRWGLGAYVNYRIPRTSVATVLDRIADQVCPSVASQEGILRFGDVQEFVEAVGPEAEPLADQEIVAFGCHHEGECLAVAVLFRDRRESFPESAAGLLDLLRKVIASQMSAVVRIHHRASPAWPQEAADEREEGEWDAAA